MDSEKDLVIPVTRVKAQSANPRMTFSAFTLRAGVLETSSLMVSSPRNDVESVSRASQEAAVRYVSPKPC
jgi:hypothetical protein